MKASSYFLLTALVLALPVIGVISNQSEHGDRIERVSSEETGMSPEWAKYILGIKNNDGVASIVYLNPTHNPVEEHDLNKSHHVMVVFGEIGTGLTVENAAVEIKVVAPNGTIENTDLLFAMDGGFGTNIVLKQQGKYQLHIHAVLPDGKLRIFEHYFVNKMSGMVS